VPGLIIVAARRHFTSVEEMTPSEVDELLPFVQRLRRAQRRVLGTEHTYYFYNEDTTHHFHLWMVPRHPWMAEFGRSVESLRPALRHAREAMSSEAQLNALARISEQLRSAMTNDS
jgi:diadenosine tetraphosphate (Ap4A) HIT family hydrolase